jgi:hypothetical protein
MGLLGASLTALISMLNGIAASQAKEDKPQFPATNQFNDPNSVSVEVDDKRSSV